MAGTTAINPRTGVMMYTPVQGEEGFTGTNLLTGAPMASYSQASGKTPQQLAAEERAAQDKQRQEEGARIAAADATKRAAALANVGKTTTTAPKPATAPTTTPSAPVQTGAAGVEPGAGLSKVVVPPPTTAASDALAGLSHQGVPLQEGNPSGEVVQDTSAGAATRGLRQLGQRTYPQYSNAFAGLQRIY